MKYLFYCKNSKADKKNMQYNSIQVAYKFRKRSPYVRTYKSGPTKIKNTALSLKLNDD